MIAKTATDAERFRRPMVMFESARAAFGAWLRALNLRDGEDVLLPSYIGWSAREGSGVFDPVREARVGYRFYKMTRDLIIDVDDVARKLREGKPRLLVLIHYFGYPDPRLAEIVALAREAGVAVLEDEAHALYSDFVGGVCGRFGDACIFSLHKMLPFTSGGMIAFNSEAVALTGDRATGWFEYDLREIARVRREHASQLLRLLQPLAGKVDPLWPNLPEGVVPQTLPVVVREANRDKLYDFMNAAGFGVVSLYHTMVDVIRADEFPESHWLSRHITNLPVHQDIDAAQLGPMIDQLAAYVS